MTNRILILKAGPHIEITLNVGALMVSQGGNVTMGTMKGVATEHQMQVGSDSLHFLTADKLEGVYKKAQKTEDYTKQTNAASSSFGCSITGIHPMVIKLILATIKQVKAKPELSGLILDIPIITEEINAFVNTKIGTIIKDKKDKEKD